MLLIAKDYRPLLLQGLPKSVYEEMINERLKHLLNKPLTNSFLREVEYILDSIESDYPWIRMAYIIDEYHQLNIDVEVRYE